MRLWYGKDVEHNPSFGKQTLFVESDNPNIEVVLKVLNTLPDVEAVYFGAGEVDIKNWDFLNDLQAFPSNVSLLLETSKQLSSNMLYNFDFVIYRLPIPYVSDKLYIKYRASNVVGISSIDSFNTNTLNDLKNGQYSCDVELYNDGD